tara:strand:- start:295 stop:531 length:237 start_codon:yes stop_codon:yes gene_type:complete
MEEIRKKTVSRIAEFFNGESTNAEVDTYKKLLDFEKEVKKQFSLPDVVKSFTAEQVGDMLAKDFTTIEEAIAYFDSIK